MKRTMLSGTWLKTCYFALVTLTSATLLLSIPVTAVADYGITGLVGAYAYPGISSQRLTPLTPTAFLADDMVALGPDEAGNRGEGHYYANLASGSLGASAYGRDGFTPAYDLWGNFVYWNHFAGSGEAYVAMRDTLHFTIQAGVYEEDLVFTISGLGTGLLTSFHNGQSRGSLYAELTGYGHSDEKWPENINTGGHASNGETVMASMPFTLSVVILGAGTYTSDVVTDAHVHLAIGHQMTLLATATINDYVDNIVSMAGSEFGHTLRITGMELPDGVTGWTSDSGVFLTQMPTLVPDPSTLLLLAAGLIGVGGVRRRLSL